MSKRLNKSNKKSKRMGRWAIKIFVITLILTIVISIVAEFFLRNMSLGVALITLIALVALGAFFDCMGIAVASANIQPFVSMAAKKIRGAKQSVKILQHAEQVTNFCNDVIGDVCGIVSGVASAVIATKLVMMSTSLTETICSIAVSALVAASTVALKAMAKGIGIRNNVKVITAMGKAMALFSRDK